MKIHDGHCHFFSHSFFKAIADQKFKPAQSGGAGAAADQLNSVARVVEMLGWEAPPEDPRLLAQRWVDELDRCGVGRAALIASVPKDEDSVAAAVAAFPKRLVGFFLLDPTQSDAVERTRRGFDELGLRCVCLFPAMQRYSLQDDRVRTVLEVVAAKPGRVVFVHCGALTIGIRKKLGLPSPFDLSRGNPLDLSLLAATYPGVRFLIPHLGAGLLREALILAEVCPNVYLDTSSSNAWVRGLGITLKDALARTLAVTGPRRLVFGTDSSFFPRGWNRKILDEQLAIFNELGLDQSAQDAILGGNFEALFP